MDVRQQAQIERILEYQSNLALRSFDQQRGTVYAEHNKRGVLRSSMTIKKCVDAAAEIAQSFVKILLSQCGEVSSDPASLGSIRTAVSKLLDTLSGEIARVAAQATGRSDVPSEDGVSASALGLFDQVRRDIEAELAIAAFAFDQAQHRATPPLLDSVGQPSKKGGAPPIAFWDDMWAAIAALLYAGDLKPRSQADVERAMRNWIEDKGYSAAVSTIRRRARRLWDLISTPD